MNKNRRLTREERVNRLCRMDKIELFIGRVIMNLLAGIVLTGIFLGIVALLGMFLEWIEQSTIRMIIYFIVCGIAIIKMTLQELR